MRLRTMVEAIRRYFARLFGRSEVHAETPAKQAPTAAPVAHDAQAQSPTMPRAPASKNSRELTWDSVFARLDVAIAMGRYQQRASGPVNVRMSRLTQVAGTYIDSNDLDSYPTHIQYIDSLGLPAVISVFLMRPREERSPKYFYLAKFTCVKISGNFKELERVDGDFYEGAFTFIQEPRKKRWSSRQSRGVATHCHVFFAVNDDGTVRLLKEFGKPASIVRMMASNGGDPEAIDLGFCEDIARFFNMFRQRDMNWLVRVKHLKRNIHATFGIGPLDAPALFKDRVKVGAKSRRIFHPVRAHQRVTASGVKAIGLHHRGLRHFTWRGFECSIQIPEAHTLPMNSLTLSARDGGGVEVHDGIARLTQDMPMPRRAKAKKRA